MKEVVDNADDTCLRKAVSNEIDNDAVSEDTVEAVAKKAAEAAIAVKNDLVLYNNSSTGILNIQ